MKKLLLNFAVCSLSVLVASAAFAHDHDDDHESRCTPTPYRVSEPKIFTKAIVKGTLAFTTKDTNGLGSALVESFLGRTKSHGNCDSIVEKLGPSSYTVEYSEYDNNYNVAASRSFKVDIADLITGRSGNIVGARVRGAGTDLIFSCDLENFPSSKGTAVGNINGHSIDNQNMECDVTL